MNNNVIVGGIAAIVIAVVVHNGIYTTRPDGFGGAIRTNVFTGKIVQCRDYTYDNTSELVCGEPPQRRVTQADVERIEHVRRQLADASR